jgi:hypothetical protein
MTIEFDEPRTPPEIFGLGNFLIGEFSATRFDMSLKQLDMRRSLERGRTANKRRPSSNFNRGDTRDSTKENPV